MLAKQREILRLGDRASAERNDARALRFGVLGDDALELLALDAAEFGFALRGENLRDRMAPAGFGDAFIEIGFRPAELAGKQARGGGFAAAHESGEADESAKTVFNRHRIQSVARWCKSGACFASIRSIALQDVDCTIEGTQFDAGAAGVERSEKRVAESRQEVVMRRRVEAAPRCARLPLSELALRSNESPGEKRTSMTPL